MALRKCSPTQRGPKAHERNIKTAEHKPKAVAARFVKTWKTQLGRGTQVCAIKAEATAPRGWDYGFYGVFEITLADGNELRAAVVIHYDGPAVRDFNRPGNSLAAEASGTVTVDAEYGGVVATYRGRTWEQVEAELINQTGRHLAPKAKPAGNSGAAAKPKAAQRKALIAAIWRSKHADYRSKRGDQTHPSIMMMGKGGGAELWPLDTFSDADLRELAAKLKIKAPTAARKPAKKLPGFPPLAIYTTYRFGSAQHERAAIRRDNNGFTAVTPTQSKIFKTQGGAEGWLVERIGAENMSEAKLDVPDDMPARTVKRGAAAPKIKRSPLKPRPFPLREGVGAGAAQPTAAEVAEGPSRPRTAAEVAAGVWLGPKAKATKASAERGLARQPAPTLTERERSTLTRTIEEIGGGDFVPTGAAQTADVERLEALGLVYRERLDSDGPTYFTASRAGEAHMEKLWKGAGMTKKTMATKRAGIKGRAGYSKPTKKKATKKATKPAPRADQMAALRKYRAAAGDDWKAQLSRDWFQAGSRVVDADTYALLHQLRNSHGPSWLLAFQPNGKATKAPAKKKATKKKATKGDPRGAVTLDKPLFEVYYTVLVPYSDTPTKWHPQERSGPFSVISRGAFPKRSDAVKWAQDNLRGNPYSIRDTPDVTRPKAAYYRSVDAPQLDRLIATGGESMKKSARAEKRRRKVAAESRQGSLAFGNGNGGKAKAKANGNGNGKGLSAREKAAAAWLRSGGKR